MLINILKDQHCWSFFYSFFSLYLTVDSANKTITEQKPTVNNRWLRSNGIILEKLELFHDFVTLLINNISATYLDVIETDEEVKGHFMWCWKKTIEQFGREGIEFYMKGDHFAYFEHFFLMTFYANDDKDSILKICQYNFDDFFSPHTPKNEMEGMIITDIYKSLDSNLKNGNNKIF